MFGAITDEIADMGGETAEWYRRMGGSEEMVDAYRASVVAMAGMTVAIYAVQILLRMRSEEGDGRLEPVLAAAVSRTRWLIANLLNAGLGAAGLLVVFAVGMGLGAGAVLGDVPGQVRAMLEAALVQLPAILVVAGAVGALSGLLPRAATTLSWALVLTAVLLGPLFGAATFQLPSWAQDLSPFTHTPKLPGAELTAAPVLALLAVAVALVAAGLVSLRRRNLALPV